MKILFLLMLFFTTSVSAQQLPEQLVAAGWRTDASKAIVDLDEIEMNIPRDAIASIDRPEFVSLRAAARWLDGKEPVLALELNGQARAYPLQILIWHEIVNDVLGAAPVAVTFCPLCYSAVAFDRRLDDDILEMGVSGMLRHSDMVMYDRGTHSLWQQITGQALVGEHAGRTLTAFPAQIISFDQFREVWPDGDVLSRETGMDRAYGQNPYAGYDDINARPWLYRGPEDGRLRPMEKVVGIVLDGRAVAFPHTDTRAQGVVNYDVDGTGVVVFHVTDGAVSALDGRNIAKSRNLGSTGVFERTVEGRLLTFERRDGHFADEQTGTRWRFDGTAVSGALKGHQLKKLVHMDVFAFAWLVLYPDTAVWQNTKNRD